MIRTTLLRSVRCASALSKPLQQPALRTLAPGLFIKPARLTPSFKLQSQRWYSAPAALTKEEVEGRIIDILKNFDKVTDHTKLSNKSHFSNDLGLDSLDTVEVVMAIEEEFSIEIPDKEADAIHSINQAVDYIMSQPDAH